MRAGKIVVVDRAVCAREGGRPMGNNRTSIASFDGKNLPR
jgi:hypothetical protein